jgi:multiple RNA-binding domain-containing protein 1
LYVRNLHYGCKEEDLETLFKPYGPLVEVNMPIDNFSKKPKGFAHITCMFPEKALKAFTDLDGKIFQGRMLHILPGKTKDDAAESTADSLNFKKKKELEQKKKAQSNHNWNSLFINSDSVANLMAARYNVDKSQLFDVHTSTNKNKAGNSIAVKLAVGETQIVNDMRKFLIRNGVKLDSFNSTSDSTQRSKTVILIKNLPNNTNENEIKELLKKQGVNDMKRLVMPEYGVACLIEFNERQEARDCFKKLAYKKFKTGPLYLEWAPVDIFEGDQDELEKIKKEDAEEEKKKEQEVIFLL